MADFQHTSILLTCHIFCRNPIFYRELVPTAIFWRVFRNFRLSCLTSQANCCPQLETLKCIEDATFIPVETKRFKLITTGCSVPTFDELLPGFRDVRISLHGWQYNEPSGACFGHLKLREWFCDIWNFFNTPKLSGGWLCCGQKLYFWIDLHLLFLGRRGTPFFSHGRSIVKKRIYFFHFRYKKATKIKVSHEYLLW